MSLCGEQEKTSKLFSRSKNIGVCGSDVNHILLSLYACGMVQNRKISLLHYDIVKFLFVSEEGVRDMDEEIIIPDEPPVYEPPPEYNDTLKSKLTEARKTKLNSRR